MTPDELLQLIAKNEGQHIEFKLESEKQVDLAEVLMAFANADGGHLLVGVTDDGEVVGVKNVKAVIDRLHQAARRIDPSLHDAVKVELLQVADQSVVLAEVRNDLSATYSLAGQFKVREGSFNRQMASADVIGHAVQRGSLDYEQTGVPQATLDDLSEQKVKTFLVSRLRTGIPDRPLNQLLADMKVATLGADRTWRPTVVGLLFFGNWPQFYLNHTTILAARLVGPRGTKIIDRATIEGNVPEMIDRAVQFVQRNTRHGLNIGRAHTAQAQEVDEYPEAAVRETITNACCHRDYLAHTPIQLKIYDDRLVVRNPGGLLPGLDPAHLEGKHKTRNPLLADWLHTLGYVERFGIGIIRMQEAMAVAGLPAPLFHNQPEWFEVTLPGPGAAFMQADQGSPATASVPSASSPQPLAFRVNQPWYSQSWTFASGTQQRI